MKCGSDYIGFFRVFHSMDLLNLNYPCIEIQKTITCSQFFVKAFHYGIFLWIPFSDWFLLDTIVILDHFGEFSHELRASVQNYFQDQWYLFNHTISKFLATASSLLVPEACISSNNLFTRSIMVTHLILRFSFWDIFFSFYLIKSCHVYT